MKHFNAAIQRLVNQGVQNLDEVSTADRQRLTALFMKEADPNTLWHYMTDLMYSCYLPTALLAALESNQRTCRALSRPESMLVHRLLTAAVNSCLGKIDSTLQATHKKRSMRKPRMQRQKSSKGDTS